MPNGAGGRWQFFLSRLGVSLPSSSVSVETASPASRRYRNRSTMQLSKFHSRFLRVSKSDAGGSGLEVVAKASEIFSGVGGYVVAATLPWCGQFGAFQGSNGRRMAAAGTDEHGAKRTLCTQVRGQALPGRDGMSLPFSIWADGRVPKSWSSSRRLVLKSLDHRDAWLHLRCWTRTGRHAGVSFVTAVHKRPGRRSGDSTAGLGCFGRSRGGRVCVANVCGRRKVTRASVCTLVSPATLGTLVADGFMLCKDSDC